jgi:hypothetical protein
MRGNASVSRHASHVCSSNIAILRANGIIGQSIKNRANNVLPSYMMRLSVEEQCHTGSTEFLNLLYRQIVYHTTRPPNSNRSTAILRSLLLHLLLSVHFTIVTYFLSKTNYEINSIQTNSLCTHVLSALHMCYQPLVRYQPSVKLNQSYHDWMNQSCHDWMMGKSIDHIPQSAIIAQHTPWLVNGVPITINNLAQASRLQLYNTSVSYPPIIPYLIHRIYYILIF